jgi:hypothetical protein
LSLRNPPKKAPVPTLEASPLGETIGEETFEALISSIRGTDVLSGRKTGLVLFCPGDTAREHFVGETKAETCCGRNLAKNPRGRIGRQ